MNSPKVVSASFAVNIEHLHALGVVDPYSEQSLKLYHSGKLNANERLYFSLWGSSELSTSLIRAKTRFYDCLVEGSGNETLGNVLRQLHARAMVLRATSLSQPGRNTESEREIAVIMKAIRKRDGAAARKASVSHIEKATQAALKVLKAREAAEAQPAKAVRKRA